MRPYKTAIANSCSLRLHIYESLWFIFRLCRKMNHISPFFASEASKKKRDFTLFYVQIALCARFARAKRKDFTPFRVYLV
jgi:hypothetical protein